MTLVRRGCYPSLYANDRRVRRSRDKDGRIVVGVFEARKREGAGGFQAWLGEDPKRRLDMLCACLESSDARVLLRAVKLLLWIHFDLALKVAADLTPEEAAWLDEYRTADHGRRRAMSWKARMPVDLGESAGGRHGRVG